MDIKEINKKIDLYQKVMNGCGKYPYSLAQAIRGEKEPEGYCEFQELIREGGLEESFFENADPLYTRAKKKRDLYVSILEEKKLFHGGISIA